MDNEKKPITNKGRVFDGWFSGAKYDHGSKLFGFREELMRRAAMAIPLSTGQRILDIGCGTAALSKAAAKRIGPRSTIVGIDLSEKQLARARKVTADSPVSFEFHIASMDELPFESESFDAVISSMAMHEVPPGIRRDALREAARVLKPKGVFGLVDWSRPKIGIASLIWMPFLLGQRDSDNWQNRYPLLCSAYGLILDTDVYLNSLIRCQVFHKD